MKYNAIQCDTMFRRPWQYMPPLRCRKRQPWKWVYFFRPSLIITIVDSSVWNKASSHQPLPSLPHIDHFLFTPLSPPASCDGHICGMIINAISLHDLDALHLYNSSYFSLAHWLTQLLTEQYLRRYCHRYSLLHITGFLRHAFFL